VRQLGSRAGTAAIGRESAFNLGQLRGER
jgi:hypothetical protein